MGISFQPHFTITTRLAKLLARLEAARQKMKKLKVSKRALQANDERLQRYFALLEDEEAVDENLSDYLAALSLANSWASSKRRLTEKMVKTLHAHVMGHVSPTLYRKGQNGVFDGRKKRVIYLPPKPEDVPSLMKSFVAWVNAHKELPAPLRAAIVHLGLNSIHPYYDGNGRTARVLTSFILKQEGYDMCGLLCLEEQYARGLKKYYDALSLGHSHSYYKGLLKGNIHAFLLYFCKTYLAACELAIERAKKG